MSPASRTANLPSQELAALNRDGGALKRRWEEQGSACCGSMNALWWCVTGCPIDRLAFNRLQLAWPRRHKALAARTSLAPAACCRYFWVNVDVRLDPALFLPMLEKARDLGINKDLRSSLLSSGVKQRH